MEAITAQDYIQALNGAICHGTPERLDRERYDVCYYVEHNESEFVEVARTQTEYGQAYYGRRAYRIPAANLKAAHRVLDDLLSAY